MVDSLKDAFYAQLEAGYKERNVPAWKPQTAFEIFMNDNVAQLMGFAKPYVGSLTASSVGPFLGDALDIAAGDFNPKTMRNHSMLTWWDECLREVAMSRNSWKVRTFDGWKWVSGWELGREEC